MSSGKQGRGKFYVLGVVVGCLIVLFILMYDGKIRGQQQTSVSTSDTPSHSLTSQTINGLVEDRMVQTVVPAATEAKQTTRESVSTSGKTTSPQQYTDTSASQFNAGNKQAAIDTLKQGLAQNPDSDLLKSKLDVMTKEQFSDPNIDATRG